MWNPFTEGSPAIAANSPAPTGRAAATSTGSAPTCIANSPNFDGLNRFYRDRRSRRKPFVLGEWALWGPEDPAFVRRLFAWMALPPARAKMHLYNQGALTDGPFRLNRYPRSRAVIRTALANRRYLQRP